MRSILRLFDKIAPPLLGTAVVVFFVMETNKQLRRRKQNRLDRIKTNASVAATGLLALRGALLPAMVAGSKWSQTKRFGLVQWLPLPVLARTTTSLLLLDYTNYIWHQLNHQLPWLWRFHNVHHTDMELDISTAWRFHAGEVLASILFRGGMIVLIGASPLTVIAYEILFEMATAFHHSNWRLPFGLEKNLSKIIVTPRMHGIHHSIVLRETNSNYSVILSCWDRMHGTIRLNIPQDAIDIGVPAYRNPDEQTALNLLAMPFQKQRSWQLPDGTTPDRTTNGKKQELAE